MSTTVLASAIAIALLPKLGEELNGGKFQGLTTLPDGTHCAISVLGFAEERANHADQVAWAKERGGQLASRAVFNLLIATMGDAIPEGVYWTADEYSASLAWFCGSYGGQYRSYRSSELGAVSVSLIPVTA